MNIVNIREIDFFFKKLNYLYLKKNLKGDYVILFRFLIKKKILLYIYILGNGFL